VELKMGDYNQIQDYNSDTKQRVSPGKNILVFSLLALMLLIGTSIFLFRYIKDLKRAEANEVLFPEKEYKKEKPEVSYKSRLRMRLSRYNRQLEDIRYKENTARLKSESVQEDYNKMERFYKSRIKTRSIRNSLNNNSLTLDPNLNEYYKGRPMTKKRLEKSEKELEKAKNEYLEYKDQLKKIHYNLSRTKAKLGELD
jgi:chromosome segregation ATPase